MFENNHYTALVDIHSFGADIQIQKLINDYNAANSSTSLSPFSPNGCDTQEFDIAACFQNLDQQDFDRGLLEDEDI